MDAYIKIDLQVGLNTIIETAYRRKPVAEFRLHVHPLFENNNLALNTHIGGRDRDRLFNNLDLLALIVQFKSVCILVVCIRVCGCDVYGSVCVRRGRVLITVKQIAAQRLLLHPVVIEVLLKHIIITK